MKVYIIYDRYENDEWFSIYNICKSIDEVRQVYKQSLLDFLGYGPDDCHSFQCQEVEVSNKVFKILKDYMDTGESDYGYKIMKSIFHSGSECLFWTDGCSDNIDVFGEYLDEYYPNVEAGTDEWYDLQAEFYSDPNLLETELKKYIDNHYNI
jgi:hypothetical protein